MQARNKQQPTREEIAAVVAEMIRDQKTVDTFKFDSEAIREAVRGEIKKTLVTYTLQKEGRNWGEY